jgi:hypothetical protein
MSSSKSGASRTLTRNAIYVQSEGYIEIPNVRVSHIAAGHNAVESVRIRCVRYPRAELSITASKIQHKQYGWAVLTVGDDSGKFASIADAADTSVTSAN